eukprot:scaffold232456_cov33-Tisochrysis_lutea.AAC.3
MSGGVSPGLARRRDRSATSVGCHLEAANSRWQCARACQDVALGASRARSSSSSRAPMGSTPTEGCETKGRYQDWARHHSPRSIPPSTPCGTIRLHSLVGPDRT